MSFLSAVLRRRSRVVVSATCVAALAVLLPMSGASARPVDPIQALTDATSTAVHMGMPLGISALSLDHVVNTPKSVRSVKSLRGSATPTPGSSAPKAASPTVRPAVKSESARGSQRERPAVRTSLVTGVNAGALVLPLGDTIGDTVTIKVASAVLAADQPIGDAHSFSLMSGAVEVKSFASVAASRVSTTSATPCDPSDVIYGYVDPADCPTVRDVWTFTWDGLDTGGLGVPVGDYVVRDDTASADQGIVIVREIALTTVSTTNVVPIVMAPFVDQILDEVVVNVSGQTYGSVAIPTTGTAEVQNLAGTTIYSHADLSVAANSHAVTVSGLLPGSYRLVVDLVYNSIHVVGQFPISVVMTAVNSTAISTASTRVFPYVDGYLDSVRVSVRSVTTLGRAIGVSGRIDVIQGGRVLRTLPVTSSSQDVRWNGMINGTVRAGRYALRAVVQGPQGTFKTSGLAYVDVATSAATRAAIGSSLTTVYPVTDGYRDSVVITEYANTSTGSTLPGRTVLEVRKGSRLVKSWSLNGTGRHSVTWNGRDGGGVSNGTYTLKVMVTGPEGGTVSATKSITVSDKKRTAVPFSLKMTPYAAYDNMASGTYWAGVYAGTQWLWGCTYSGCDPDIAYYSWDLPTTMGGYGEVVVSTCTRSTHSAPFGRFSYTDPTGNLVGSVWRLGNDYPACYFPRTNAPSSAFNGRRLNWLVGNVDTYELSYWQIDYFEITGKKYVLQ